MVGSARWPRGASDAECTIAEGDEFSANVRMREMESLKEAGSRGVGLRILMGEDGPARPIPPIFRAKASTGWCGPPSSWPRSPPRIRTRGCPSRRSWARSQATCGLYSADVEGLETDAQDRTGQRAEEAALARRSAHFQFRRRLVRVACGPAHFRQLARLRGRIPHAATVR